MIINSDEVLTKVTNFRYFRKENIVRIEIHEKILGEGENFTATPIQVMGMVTKNEKLHIKRDTEEKALEDLISALQTLSHEEIFPK